MAVIFRVENKHGVGPYRLYSGGRFNGEDYCSERAGHLARKHNNDLDHPGPARSCYNPSRLEFFGFDSAKQAIKWFEDDWASLARARFLVVMYDAEIAWSDGKQVTFKKNYALKKRTYSVRSFLRSFGRNYARSRSGISNDQIKKFVKRAIECGWKVEKKRSNHIHVTNPNTGDFVILSTTRCADRAVLNYRSNLRRAGLDV